MTRTFRLTDSTLRDGSHAVSHTFTDLDVKAIVSALDASGVPVIEVSHGDGLGGSSFNYGFSATDDMRLIRAAAEAARTAKIAVLLLPGIGVKEDLKRAHSAGATVARIATHCTEADISQQHLSLARQLGMEAVGFLMMAHMTQPDELLEQAKMMEDYGAQCVYVVDSAGAMTVDDAAVRVAKLKNGLSCQVGIHAHNNLALSVANSLSAIQEGADQVDACTTGLGAGAGNCPTEVLIAVCEKMGMTTGISTLDLMDVAEELVRPFSPSQGIVDRTNLALGYAGVYGSFTKHVQRAAKRYQVDVKELILRLGDRGVVGGQEDMIIDAAIELSASDSGRS